MIWLTWRQFRAQAIVAAVALVVFAIVLVLTESHMSSLYTSSGLSRSQNTGLGSPGQRA